MTKLHFIWVGKTSSSYVKEGLNDFLSRIQKWHPCSVTEIPERHDPAHGGAKRKIEREKREIWNRMERHARLIAFDREGEELDSVSFACLLEGWLDSSASSISFILGGPEGLSREILTGADKIVSLSKMTFPHEMSRLILAEQVYRALTIIRNHPYPR